MLGSHLRPNRAGTKRGEHQIPTDTTTLIAFGIGAAVVLWLVLSVLKKALGLIVLAAVVGGGWFIWNNPEWPVALQGFIAL